jgi:hypothetical protein
MISTRNPGRVAGFWYLLLCVIGPLRLIYIPSKLFVPGSAPETAKFGGQLASQKGES